MYDVVIIGGGVVGCAMARNLSKYNANIALFEKELDVSLGASKGNSGIVHGGYAGKYGTLKGQLCIKGNHMYKQLENELHFGYKPIGGVMLAFEAEDFQVINKQIENGKKVGQTDMVMMSKEEMLELLPHVNQDVLGGVYIPSIGITSPYEFTIALAENAISNGVIFKLGEAVETIKHLEDKTFEIHTTKGIHHAKVIINMAGLGSGVIATELGDPMKIKPRKGQYILLGKDQVHLADKVVFQTPGPKGKGILVTPTVHDNLMIGPDAEDLMQDVDTDTTVENLEKIITLARLSVPDFNLKRSLTTFSGIRAMSETSDFIIERGSKKGVYHAVGIDSPGLTSSPAIAVYVEEMLLADGVISEKKQTWSPNRKAIIVPKGKDFDGDINSDQPEKHIICRCEQVTESEILDALSRGISLQSTDAVKRRTRAGMGNCQGQFCRPRVKQIMADYYKMSEDNIPVRTEETSPPQRVDIKTIRKLEV